MPSHFLLPFCCDGTSTRMGTVSDGKTKTFCEPASLFQACRARTEPRGQLRALSLQLENSMSQNPFKSFMKNLIKFILGISILGPFPPIHPPPTPPSHPRPHQPNMLNHPVTATSPNMSTWQMDVLLMILLDDYRISAPTILPPPTSV